MKIRQTARGYETEVAGTSVFTADRTALALVDASEYPDGTLAGVADLGDGQGAQYTLTRSSRVADGKLRIAAVNKTGYLWIAGDGASLHRIYWSAKIDLTVLTTNNLLIPAIPGFYWTPTAGAPGRVIMTDLVGTITTGPSIQAGNSPGKTNVIGLGVIPSNGSWTNAQTISSSTPPINVGTLNAPNGTGTPANAATLADLTTAVTLDVAVAATGTGLTLKARYVVDGLLVSTSELASG
jgi:hypothetical protein